MHLRGIATLATCTLALAAQDSTRPVSGLPGDAVDAHSTSEQVNAFVLDLVSFTTDWGTTFALGPISKASRPAGGTFYNALQGSQSAGTSVLTGQQYPTATYDLWTTAGEGVNGAENNAPAGSVSPAGTSTQMAFAVSEASGEMETVVVAAVNYDPTDPTRLHVTRVNSAITGPDEFTSNSNFGLGQVDADANVSFRADDFSLNGANQVFGNNLYTVDALARSAGSLNEINGSGPQDAAASAQLLVGSATTHNVPGAIPEDVATRPVLAGSNFNSEYVYESAAGVLSSTITHLGAAGDHRGGMHFSKAIAVPGCVGTLALLGQDGAGTTDRIIVFGVDVNGNVCGTPINLLLPAAVTDNWDGFSWPPPAVGSGTLGEPVHHGSQTAFGGGNGQVAVGTDPGTGEILVATTVVVDDPALANANENPANAIVVGRFTPGSPGGVTWTLAAYNDRSGTGKAFTDGAGTTMGTLVELNAVTGGIPNGPSMSSPAIDSAGNVWFQSAASIDLGGGATDEDTILLRAVYDSASFSYQLEKILEPGDRFMGANSATEYMITFMGIADSNSISSGAMFSGNVVQDAWNDLAPGTLVSSDPRTLGGLVVNVEITYDVNGDGLFEGGTTTPDQEYNVLMYIGSDGSGPPPPVFNYCVAKPSDALSCLGTMGWSGPVPPVSGANDFSVSVTGIDGQKPGIFFAANTAQAAIPFLGGTLCFLPPLNRGSINFSFGTNGVCDGSYGQIVNDGLFFPPASPKGFDGGPGGTTFMQAWYRSPCMGCATGFDIGLSDAIEINWAP